VEEESGRLTYTILCSFRFTGYWWSPTLEEESGRLTYTILYEFVDESTVDIIPVSSLFEL